MVPLNVQIPRFKVSDTCRIRSLLWKRGTKWTKWHSSYV